MMGKDVGDEAYRAISDREASDLLTLMKSCDHAVTNADLFVEDLRTTCSKAIFCTPKQKNIVLTTILVTTSWCAHQTFQSRKIMFFKICLRFSSLLKDD